MKRFLYVAAFIAAVVIFGVGSKYIQAQNSTINEYDISNVDPTKIYTDVLFTKQIDDPKAVLVLATDDGFKENADSFYVWTGGLNGDSTATTTGLPWVGTHFVWAGRVRNHVASSGRDTSATVYASPRAKTSIFSKWDLQRFKDHGWEIGLHNRGWPHTSDGYPNIWHVQGFMARGDTTETAYALDIAGGISDLALLGFNDIVSYSYAQSSASPFMFKLLNENGIKCATSSSNLAKYGNTYTRWNYASSTIFIRSTVNGWNDYNLGPTWGDLPHRYEMPSTIVTTSSLAEAKEFLDHAIEFRSAVILLTHNVSELGWMSEFLHYADRKRGQGVLQSMTMSQMYDYYYLNDPSDIANLIPTNFEDTDSAAAYDDLYRDMMPALADSFLLEADGWMSEGGVQHKALKLGLGHGKVADGPYSHAGRATWMIPAPGVPGDCYCFQVMVQYDTTAHTYNSGDSVGIYFKQYMNTRESTRGINFSGSMYGGYSAYSNTQSVPRGGQPRANSADMADVVPTWANETAGKWYPIRGCMASGDGDLLEVGIWWDTSFARRTIRISAPYLFKYNKKARR